MSTSILIRRITGTGKGKEENLATQEISFGTGPHNTVRYDPTWDRGVAPSHARLWRDEGGAWWLQDAGSSTGTFVNGQRVTLKRKVGGSTVIELGQNGPKVEAVLPAVAEGGGRAPSRAGAPSAGGGAGKWLAIAAAVAVLAGGGFFFLSGTPKKAPPVASGSVEWEPKVDMGGQIFPSYLVAIATMKQTELPNAKAPNRLGDPGGIICVEVTSPRDHAKVSVEVEPNAMIKGGSIEVELPQAGETYRIYPKMDYHYDALLKVRQAVPLTLVAKTEIDGVKDSKALTVRVCSINDCPFVVGSNASDDKDEGERCTWMFAAYVNENHPFSEEIRKEALKSGAVSQFDGYQSGEDGVALQVFAIWNVLQQRGVRYSNVTTISGSNERVHAQQVRFVDQTISSSQANCVDGSIIFASILRQIGIEPVLVVVPGHMFVGFYLKEGDRDSLAFLETTMMGSTDLSEISSFKGMKQDTQSSIQSGVDQVIGKAMSEQQKAQMSASAESFKKAVGVAAREFAEHKDKIIQEKGLAGLIEIRDARKRGVMPIAYHP
ncbi:FHA domain-containing protein [Prosthecobacter sp.]|uniref:FHA domain-containing protein n=1 Tax=Prosthecobacter sp. TaxID=1965333 RepID=UPI003782EC3C